MSITADLPACKEQNGLSTGAGPKPLELELLGGRTRSGSECIQDPVVRSAEKLKM